MARRRDLHIGTYWDGEAQKCVHSPPCRSCMGSKNSRYGRTTRTGSEAGRPPDRRFPGTIEVASITLAYPASNAAFFTMALCTPS
jgi:hypothetical protein